ncbi:MAG: Wzz/FepE/Etk N-terminal domain-containing protein [Abyssibacter sp.]|uniref:GumC family protein n=1 Tax=Abyssibacter sp. TaxID=2320200 RepID=UPI00321B28AA
MNAPHSPTPAAVPQGVQLPGIALMQVQAMLLARWKLIVAFGLGCAVLAALLSKLVLPKTYVATATVLVDFEVNDPLSGRDFPAHLATSYMATQIEFMRSPEVLIPALETLGWASDPERLSGIPNASDPNLRRNWLRNQLAQQLSIHQGDDSRFIYVSFTGETPTESADGANIVARTFVREQQARQQGPARLRVDQAESKLASLRERVSTAEAQVAQFREQSGLIALDSDLRDEQTRLIELERRLSEARARRREAQQRLNSARNADASVLGSNLIQSMKREVAALEARLADLSTTLGPRHPEYIAVSRELMSARMRLDAEIDHYVESARAELNIARSQESGLAAEHAAVKAALRSEQSTKDDAAQYLRELDTAKQLYQQALREYDKTLLGAGTEYSNASVSSPAQPPLEPDSPKAKLNTIVGGILGGVLGVALALLLELVNRKIRCRTDLERDLGLVVIGDLTLQRRRGMRLPG